MKKQPYRPTYEQVAARVGKASIKLDEAELALCINGVAEIYQQQILKMDENYRAVKTEAARSNEETVEKCRALLRMLEERSAEWCRAYNVQERILIETEKRAARLKAAATRA